MLDKQQVRFLVDGEVEFPGVEAGVSVEHTEPVDPVRDVQNNSDAASPMPASTAPMRKKKRKTDVPMFAVVPDVATQSAAADPRSPSPPIRKKKKKVQAELVLQEESLTDNDPDGMSLDETVPRNVPLFGHDGPPGVTDMDVETAGNVAVTQLTGGTTQALRGDLAMGGTPHLDQQQRQQLRMMSDSGQLEAYLRRALSPQYVAETSANTPVPASSADLMPPPKSVSKTPVIVLEGTHSPEKPSGYVPVGQSLQQLAQGQVASSSRAGAEIAQKFSPAGWPAEDVLHTYETIEAIFAFWKLSNNDTKVNEIMVTAHKVDARIPQSKAKLWRALYLAWVRAVQQHKLLDRKDVTDLDTLDRFWFQRDCPEQVMEPLMEYRPGPDDDLPQWPRITRRGLLDVFPNLQEASSTEVQDKVRFLMSSQPNFQTLLEEAWMEFQQFRGSLPLPDVPPNCARPELRLETDLWKPGSDWITPARKSYAHTKQYKPVPLATQAESGEIPGISMAQDQFQAPPPAPAQSRSQGRGEGAGRGLVRGDPGRGGRGGYATAPGPRSHVQMVIDAALAVGEQPNAANLAWAERADQGQNHQQQQPQQGNPTPHVPDQRTADEQPVRTEPVPNIVPRQTVPRQATAPPVVDNPADDSTDPDGEDLRQRQNDPDYDPEYDGGTRPAGTRRTLDDSTMEANQFLEEANRINPDCPLPVNTSRFAVSDYLGWGVPKMSNYAYKAFANQHTAYVPNGPVTWEDWTFSIRESCRNLGLSHDQAWRLANRLLPADLKRTVEDTASESTFKGLCWNSWKILVGQDTNHINPITEAKKEIALLKYTAGETVPQFLQRFNRIVQKGTAESTGLEDSMTPYAVLTQLHNIMQNPGRHGPGWLIGQWRNKYGVVHEALVTKNNLGMNDSGCKYTKAECETHIRQATTELIAYAKSMYNTRVNTANDIEVLYSAPANTSTTNPGGTQQTPQNQQSNGRFVRRDRPIATGGNVLATVSRRSNPVGVRCRGGERQYQTLSVGEALPPPPLTAQVNVAGPAQTRLPRSERPAVLGPVQPEWAAFPRRPTGLRMSPQAQAAAEFGLITFELAADRFGQRLCAACGAPHASCAKIRDCGGIPANMKGKVSERAQWLWGTIHNAALERQRSSAQ